MVFCELCCSEYKNIDFHNRAKRHVRGITHRCDECDKGFSSARALQRHNRLDTTPCTDITFCKLCWKEYVDMKNHLQSNNHLRGVKFNCHECGIGLSGPQALRRHYNKSTCPAPPTISQYRCCDCDCDYSSLETLRAHLEDESVHPPRVIKAVNLSLFCEKCDREFKSSDALKSHLASVKHNPLCEPFKCVGKACNRRFQSPSQMLSHLESGTCKSKITWERIDQLMIENDTENIVTEPDASATRAACKEEMRFALGFDDSSSVVSSIDGGVGVMTPMSAEDRSRRNSISTDSSHPVPLLTPSERSEDSGGEGSQATITRRASINSDDFAEFDFRARHGLTRRDSESSSSSQMILSSPTGILTPQSESNASRVLILPEREYSCSMCSEKKKKFKTYEGLQAHIKSQAHASKIYHCPVSLLLDISEIGIDGLGIGEKKLKVKKFKTLSGVTHHVEAGACARGKEAFGLVVDFVNDKLRVFELGEMKPILRVREV